jgi:hypothetical protein
MFVVIQELQLKKPPIAGAYKEYEVQSTTITFEGVTKTHYSYYPKYDAGRFERPHREAYKISIHHNYRENGKVKTKQCSLGTIGYYALAEDWGIYDYVSSGLDRAAEMFSDTDNLYDLVEAKIKPIQEKIKREYHKTEEYKVTQERDKVQKKYQKAKAAFAKKYSVDANEYDYCYNIFGEVMNQAYIDEIKRKAATYSSYRDNCYSNYTAGSGYSGYSGSNYGSYSVPVHSNHTDEDKQFLKQFYKVLSLKFHPDMNPDKDTTKEMQLLNKLKDEWGL